MQRLLVLTCCLAVVGLVGCGGSNLGQVSGKVTMDGEPLPNVMVTFVPQAGGRSSTGTTNAAGEYELVYVGETGAEIGTHKVSVKSLAAPAEAVAETSSDSAAYEAQALGSASDYDNATTTEKIPAKYNTETTLVEEVKPGSNTINLELTST